MCQAHDMSGGALWWKPAGQATASRAIYRNISRRHGSRGQALLEGMVGLVALVVMFWAIPVLGRYQDIVLQSAHASRYAAFLSALGVPAQEDVSAMAGTAYFSGSPQRWRTASGEALMPIGPEISTRRVPDTRGEQPGSSHAAAAMLRREWRVGDDAMLQATVLTQPRDVVPLGIAAPDFLRINRSTSILTGAGYASSDMAVQQRVAHGASGWAQAAARSASAGREVAARMQAVDEAWARPHPDFDWLGAWQALVPADRLARQP